MAHSRNNYGVLCIQKHIVNALHGQPTLAQLFVELRCISNKQKHLADQHLAGVKYMVFILCVNIINEF